MKRLTNILLAVFLFALPLEAQLGGVKYFRDNSPGYRQATLDLEKRMTNIWSGQRKRQFNWLHKAMWTQAIWQGMDVTYLFAAHAQQPALLNIIKRSHNATAVNSPTFTVDGGMAGNGTTSYVNSNFIPSTGVRYAQNSASAGLYSRTDGAQAGIELGVNGPSGNWVTITPRFTGDSFGSRINSIITNLAGITNTDGRGFFSLDRGSSTSQRFFRNGTFLLDSTVTSSPAPDASVFIGARNNAATANNFSTRQISMVYLGGSLSASQHYHFNRLIEAYMDAVGAGVQN